MSAKKTVGIENTLNKGLLSNTVNSLPNVIENAELWLQPIAAGAKANPDVEAAIYFASRGMKELIDTDNLKDSWHESICEKIESRCDFDKLTKEVKKRVKSKTISFAGASEVLSASRFFAFSDLEEGVIDATFFRAVEWYSIVGFEPWLDSLADYASSRLGREETLDLTWELFYWCRSDQALASIEKMALQSALWILLDGSADKMKPWKESRNNDYIPVAGILPFIYNRINPSGIDNNLITGALAFLFQTQLRSGGWAYRTTIDEPSILTTCVAIHSLAMTKPRGWKQICKKASEWLITQQRKSGYWRVSEFSDVITTVLVLDSINLANDSDIVTFGQSNRTNHLQEEVDSYKKGRLKRGEKQKYVPDEYLIPFMKKNLSYLRSPSGGELRGSHLQDKMKEDIKIRFKRNYSKGTIRNFISKIDIGKI
jgi:hypothetical protein